jgi:predicted ATPase
MSPPNNLQFIDKVVSLQRRRQAGVQLTEGATAFSDRSPVCTLRLSRYLDFTTSHLLAQEVDRAMAQAVYAQTVFFVPNQGCVRTTAARRIPA